MGEPGFWDDQRGAARISSEHARLSKRLERYRKLQRDYDDARELFSLDGDLEQDIRTNIVPLRAELDRLQEEALFTGEYDAGDAVVTIHSGEGGTDAQDWAEMLLRMYLRWGERRNLRTELLEASPGEEAIFDELEVGVATQHLVIDVPAFGVGADHDARHPQAKADLVDGWRG